ncbi:MAG: hypothetical protein U1B78_02685, partial [Dehalococcoidia bacterium]|nr:hypothetical protein [Dehalococcoidia bacterium]
MAHHLRFVGPFTIVLCALIVVAAAVTSRPNGVVQAGPPPTPTATATPSGEGDLAVDSSDS